jgi:hypothetical protein
MIKKRRAIGAIYTIRETIVLVAKGSAMIGNGDNIL